MNNALRAKETASQIISNKDINIEATNKVKAKSVDIYAKNDVNILGDNGVEILTANNTYDKTTKQSSSRIGASVSRPLDYSEAYYNYKNSKWYNVGTAMYYYLYKRPSGLGTHGYALVIPDDQDRFFKDGKLREEYRLKGYPKPQNYGGKLGWTVGGHKDEVDEKLKVKFKKIESKSDDKNEKK